MHHHHHRRRKKRPNYGTRTVEVTRGLNGFGFTISGQQPCILSCIVKNSPADHAGLRAGDFLISVNNLNVSKLPHETIVQLIGNSFGSIRMQIAENYFSDSSEEENVVHNANRGKPSYLHHKMKMNRLRNSPQKIREGLPDGSQSLCNDTRDKRSLRPVIEDIPLSVYSKNPLAADILQTSHSTVPALNTSNSSKDISNVSAMVRVNPTDNSDNRVSLEYRALVGYLGTIEMPKQIAISSKLQTVRSCIRKLRQEKRNPTTVLMTILPNCLTLQDSNAVVLATYPSSRLNYVSSSSENENRFFSLVTSTIHSINVEDDDDVATGCRSNLASGSGGLAMNQNLTISNSCHVFVVDTKICDHPMHEQKASEFRIVCTKDPISNLCLEFPNNSEYVVNLIRSMYTMRILPPAVRNSGYSRNIDASNGLHENAMQAHSPQPSNHSEVTTASSNSDSGIGFYNDCTNISDRILVVDFPNIQMMANHFASRDSRPFAGFNNIDRNLYIPGAPIESLSNAEKSPENSKNSRLTVRAMPDPKSLSRRSNDETETSENLQSTLNLNNKMCVARSCDDVLTLFDRSREEETLSTVRRVSAQMSVDDISIHSSSSHKYKNSYPYKYPPTTPSSKEHVFLQPTSCISKNKIKDEYKSFKDVNGKAILKESNKLSPKVYTEINTENNIPSPVMSRSLKYKSNCNENYDRSTEGVYFESWASLQDVYNVSGYEKHNTSMIMETTFSAPDLSNRSALGNGTPIRRWGQSSFRTPRTAENQNSLARRATSLTSSENDVFINPMDTSIDHVRAISQDMPDIKGCINENQQIVSRPQIETESGVIAWGSSFEKLLDDAAGLYTFSEFLKKEFSAENIYFWTACERFKHIESENERTAEAMKIFSKHLANNAPEPVNVDSQARILAEENLHTAGKDIFRHAQKQIFNLMKFDSYQRFIRSDLYKRCLEAEEKNQPLPYLAEDLDELLRTKVLPLASPKLKKSASNAEDRRRKSLLPWHRKTRCKSRDRGECDIRAGKSVSSASSLKIPYANSGSDIHSSRSSLSSFDMLPQSSGGGGGGGGSSSVNGQISKEIKPCSLCRVILSDGATTIVQTRPGETVGQLIERLLEKRGITYHYYDVIINGAGNKSIDINNSAQYLAGKEVLVEQRVAFKLDLPDPKVISVKSKPKKQLCDVIRPILQKYNYTMENVQVLLRDTHEQLNLSQPVTIADGKRLQIVMLKNFYSDYQNQHHKFKPLIKNSIPLSTNKLTKNDAIAVPQQNTLDEITNKVFNELLQGKVDAHNPNHRKPSDICSLKSDECASETSSIFGRIRKRDSNIPGLKGLRPKKIIKASVHQSDDAVSAITHASTTTATTGSDYNPAFGAKKPIIAKLKAGVKLQVTERPAENQDDLLEGLKRAQLARLEDQRGTEINSELPEFLKNKENITAANKLRKIRANLNCISKTLNLSTTVTNAEEEQQTNDIDRPQPAPRFSISKSKICVSSEHLNSENSNYSDGMVSIYKASPPPLPPKPKILPIKPSNWGQCGSTVKMGSPTISLPSKIPIDINRKYIIPEQTSGRTAYLEEPSSSFV